MCELKRIAKRFLSLTLVMAMVVGFLPQITVAAESSGEVTGLSDANIGLSYSGDKTDTWAAGGSTITGSIQSSSGCGTTHYQSTLSITNRRSLEVQLSFTYELDLQGGTAQVDGAAVTAGGSFSKTLAAGETVKVYIKSNSTSAPTKITLKNVTLAADITAAVTFIPAENGTYTVDGKTVTEEYSNVQSALTPYQLEAAPAEGYQFKGWYDSKAETYIGCEPKMSYNAEKDCTLTAVFAPESANLFETGGQVFEELNDAIAYARQIGVEKITLQSRSATLKGTYTIPAGVTLLVPFDAEKTLFTTTPAALLPGKQPATKKNEFRTLNLAEDAVLEVEGSLSIGGRYVASSGGTTSYMSGDYGQLQLADSSRIEVKNGGSLYAWGFVSGGSVTVEAGGTVYEWFQILDFRGGTATMGIGNKVFPFNQYDVQNVESPMTLQQGAKEIVYAAVYASSRINPSAITFIGDEGMFKIVSGSLTKAYDGTRDRIIYTVDGSAEVNNLNLKLAGLSVSSKNYVLPITNNMVVNLTGNSLLTVNQTAALLPGVQANIAKGAELRVSAGNSVYLYDADQWGGYCDTYSLKFKSVGYAPGKTYQRTEEKDLLDAAVNVDGILTAAGSIYTTESGAAIGSAAGTGVFRLESDPGTETVTYQYTQSGSAVTAHEIPITPAKLQNADGTYTETAHAAAGDEILYKDGVWIGGTAAEVTVTFDPNGGDGNMEAQTMAPGSDTALNANAFVREGYAFTGWNTEADGSGVAYDDGAAVNLSENITLYAQWQCQHIKTELRDQQDASCTEDGYSGDTCCTVCGEMLEAGTVIPAKGHTETASAAVAPTCTVPGKTEGKYCSVCGQVLIAQEDIPALGHSWDAGTMTDAPNCTEDGVMTYTCAACGEIRTEAVAATGHTPEDVEAAEPTCTQPGHEAGSRCSVCGAVLSGLGELPATGHSAVIDPAVSPTCTESGRTEGQHCEVCGQVLIEQEELPATGHRIVSDPAVSPTCTESGKTEGQHCDICGQVITAQIVIPATGHVEEIRGAKEAGLDEDGYTGDTYCTVCETLLRQGEVIPKTGAVITWIVDGRETTQTVEKGTMPSYSGSTEKAPDAQYRYTFTGWEPELTTVTEDAVYQATYSSTARLFHTVTFDPNGGEGTMEAQTVENGVDTALCRNEFTRQNHAFMGWNTMADGSGISYADGGAVAELETDLCLYAQWRHEDGWFRNEDESWNYYRDGALQKTGWTEINGNTFYLDPETGAAAIDGIYFLPYPEGYGPDAWDLEHNTDYAVRGYDQRGYFLFDGNGVFCSTYSGFYIAAAGTKVEGGDAASPENDQTLWIQKGQILWHPGLVELDGEYYYFPSGYFAAGSGAVTGDYYVSKPNDVPYPAMWGEGKFSTGRYTFDETGRLQLFDGFTDVGADTLYYVKGAKTYGGLIRLDGEYYYVNSACKVIKGRDYTVSKTNGLLPAGTYTFGADGKMLRADPTLNGIVKDGDIWYYYVNGVKSYAGLIQMDGSYYYVNSQYQVIHGRSYYISKDNGLLARRTYEFDAEGRLILPDDTCNGIVKDGDIWYYYVSGVKTYAGLIQLDGSYYYVKSDAQVIHGQSYYVSKTNGLMPQGRYSFDDEGRMVVPDTTKNGIVRETEADWYYYVNGMKTYAGLIRLDENYYYVNSQFRVIHGQKYYVSKTNGLMAAGTYTFDDEGRMIP